MKYIDLTQTFQNGMAHSPFDNSPIIKRVKFLEKDYFNDSQLISTMHIGTHIDAPSHMLDNHKKVSDYDISKFIGTGVFLDCEGEKEIGLKEVYKDIIVEQSIVLIYTGMDKLNGTDEYYYDHPKLTDEFCDFLVNKGIKLIALDFFSPDSLPLSIHKTLLQNDILIVENIQGAGQLKNVSTFKLFMIPLKIEAEGAFIRAFAEVKE